MSDQLFGKEVSGTPLETRGLAGETASAFSNLIGSPEQGAQRIGQTFGIDPSQLGLQGFAQGILSGQSPGLAGFEQANQPFQQRAINQSRSQNAQQFGTAGGRFSRNLFGANAASDAQLNQGFDQNRFQFANQARQTDIQGLASILGSLPGLQNASLAPLAAAGGFAQPGAPIWQQGFAGELLGSAGNLAGASILNPAGAGQVASGIGNFFKGLFT